jgi:hypothetical protein
VLQELDGDDGGSLIGVLRDPGERQQRRWIDGEVLAAVLAIIVLVGQSGVPELAIVLEPAPSWLVQAP